MRKPVRIYYLDILRILAIFLVVVVHTSVLPSTLSITTFPSFLLFSLAKTCVPLFLMVSGALLLGKQESYQSFFSKRAMRILIPWIIWCLVFFWIEGGEQGMFGVLLTRFWFLPLIAGLYLLTPFLRLALQHARRMDIVYILIIWFVSVSLLPYLHESKAFPIKDGGIVWQTILYSGYYLLGFGLMQLPITFPRRVTGYVLLLSGVFGAVIASFLFGGELLKYYEYISPFVIFSSIGLFLYISSFTNVPKKYHGVIRLISDAAFGIIFTHELVRLILRDYLPTFWHGELQTAEYTLVRAVFVFSIGLLLVLFIRNSPLKSILS